MGPGDLNDQISDGQVSEMERDRDQCGYTWESVMGS